MSTHLQLANSTTMAILCGITILIVLLQPCLLLPFDLYRRKTGLHPQDHRFNY